MTHFHHIRIRGGAITIAWCERTLAEEPTVEIGASGATVSPAHPKTKRIEYGVAYCNPKDSFNKAKGRMIALGRYMMRGTTIVVPVEHNSLRAILTVLIPSVLARNTVQWVSLQDVAHIKTLYGPSCSWPLKMENQYAERLDKHNEDSF